MDNQRIPHKLTGARFVRAVKTFATSEVGWKARWMAVGLIAFLFAINGMNVVNSYVGRDFMTAIEARDKAEFLRQAAVLSRRLRRLHPALGHLPLHRGTPWPTLARLPDRARR